MGDPCPDNLHGGDGRADEDGTQYNEVHDGRDNEEVQRLVGHPCGVGLRLGLTRADAEFAEAHLHVVEVKHAGDEHADGGHHPSLGKEHQHDAPLGGAEGPHDARLLRAPLGLHPEGADDAEAQVDEEEQGGGYLEVEVVGQGGRGELIPCGADVVVGGEGSHGIVVAGVIPGVQVLLLGEAARVDAGLQAENDEVLRSIITNGAVVTVNRPGVIVFL